MSGKTKLGKGEVVGEHTGDVPNKVAKRLKNLKPAWKKGQSGNPSGMSKAKYRIVEALALAARGKIPPDKAIAELWKVYEDKKVPWNVRYSALTQLIDRAYGSAPKVVEITDDADEKTSRSKIIMAVAALLTESETEGLV